MEDRKLNLDIAEAISELSYSLKQFEVRTKKYNLFFRGKSFDFDGYRPYTADDDISFIDWRASSRSDRLLVKQYKEEQKMKILFVIDISENMILGSGKRLKCEYAAEVVLALSYILSMAGHKVGYILYNDKVKEFSIPMGGLNNFRIFSDVLSETKTYGGISRIDDAIDFVLNNFDTSISSVILVSDFISIDKKTNNYLSLLSSKFETFAFMIRDQLDRTLPNINGEFILEDPRTGQQMLVDPKVARKNYEKHALKHEHFVKECFKNSSIDLLDLSTEDIWVPKVTNFIKERVQGKVAV